MRRSLILYLLLGIHLLAFSQDSNTVVTYDRVVDEYSGEVFDFPTSRPLVSGSKIIVNYQGLWPEEMKGAFEYAVKLWEEVLPVTLPIKINAVIDNLKNSNNAISEISFPTYEFEYGVESEYASLLSQIKGVLLLEYNHLQQDKYIYEIPSDDFLEGVDMIITYNKNRMRECTFSLDIDASEEKYDFISLALRDIAIGLGFTSSFTADATARTFNFPDNRLTSFETLIMKSIRQTDPRTAYSIVTQGALNISRNPSINLYAPNPWSNGISLRYFIPDGSPLSQLLTYEFKKGYIMRDLSTQNWDDIFTYALDWTRNIITGPNSTAASYVQHGSTDDVLPFKGTVVIDSSQMKEPTQVTSDVNSSFMKDPAKVISGQFKDYSINGLNSIPDNKRWTLSVLKKDGKWDVIYNIQASEGEPFMANISDIPLNYPINDYASVMYH